MHKNFLGLPFHDSDEYLNWHDQVEDAIKLRKSWDKIPKELLEDVKVLMEKAKDNAHSDESDDRAGDAL